MSLEPRFESPPTPLESRPEAPNQPSSEGTRVLPGIANPELRAAAIASIRLEIGQQLDAGNIEVATNAIDNLVLQQFNNYTGTSLETTVGSTQEFQSRLREIQQQTGIKTAVVYILARPEQLDLVMIPPEGALIYRSVPEAQRTQLLEVAQRFRGEITNVRSRPNRYLPPAQQLYKWMIAPLAADLERLGINTLAFNLDEGLRSLPIAALHDGQQFLVEKFSLGVIPTVFLTDTRYESLADARVLAFGASEFQSLAPLPAVAVELKAIASQILEGEYFYNADFTLSNLINQRQSSPYPIIHLATHAEFKPGAPSNSYIQLWNEQLTLNRLRELGWNAPPTELLVLSACRTALGDESAELGFAGLAVQAGVKSALASLWYVSDAGTLALMLDFYHQLRSSPIKAEALRQAQISMIQGQIEVTGRELRGIGEGVTLPPELNQADKITLSHPYYWSGFTMVGSPW